MTEEFENFFECKLLSHFLPLQNKFECCDDLHLQVHRPAEQIELAGLPQILLFNSYTIEIASERGDNPLGSLLMQILIYSSDGL